jgi:hypothetical protein
VFAVAHSSATLRVFWQSLIVCFSFVVLANTSISLSVNLVSKIQRHSLLWVQTKKSVSNLFHFTFKLFLGSFTLAIQVL